LADSVQIENPILLAALPERLSSLRVEKSDVDLFQLTEKVAEVEKEFKARQAAASVKYKDRNGHRNVSNLI
jgi:hypothetical protein